MIKPNGDKVALLAVDLPSSQPHARDKAKIYALIENGKIFLLHADRKIMIAEPKDISVDTALEILVNRYFDFADKLALFEAKMNLATIKPQEIDRSLANFRAGLTNPKFVGNLKGLHEKIEKLEQLAPKRKLELEHKSEQESQESLSLRQKIVETVEQIAQRNYSISQWGKAHLKIEEAMEQWSREQKYGPHCDKAKIEELWRRFVRAKRDFYQKKRDFFKNLDQERANARNAKSAIVAKAKALKDSQDWTRTAADFKSLMTEWKEASKVRTRDDDKLWQEFKTIQDRFFESMKASAVKVSGDLAENLAKKSELVQMAQALDLSDPKLAASKLKQIQQQFSNVGNVPRDKSIQLQIELQKVSKAVAKAEEKLWNADSPSKTARQNSFKSQIEQKISRLEEQLQTANDQQKIDLESELAVVKSYLSAFTTESV
jgi:hypothetical protein